MIMNTRREMALSLLGLPLATLAAQPEAESTPPDAKPEPKPIPPPYSATAANIVSYTLYAEARGESFEGKIAVASVIKTRSLRSGKSLAEVCLQDKQFSGWNGLKAVPDYYLSGEGLEALDLAARSKCYGIAWVLLASTDKWDYLTHFYNPDKASPDWALELKGVRKIGKHIFGYIN